MVGNLGANAIFGSDRGIGADIGGAAGGVLGPIIATALVGTLGPIGAGISALLAAFGGNFLGGLLGGKPSNQLQTARITDRTGEQILDGQTGNKFSQGNQDLAVAIGSSANAFISTLEAATGSLSEFSTITGLAGDRSGNLLDFFRQDPGAGTGVTGDLRFDITDELSVLTASLEAFLASAADLDPLFRDKLTGALTGTQEEILATVNALGLFRDVSERLAALDPGETVSSYEQALRALTDPLKEQRDILREAGLPLDEINTLQKRLADDLKSGFIDGLERANRELSGLGFLDAIADQVAGFEDVFASAKFAGAGAAELVAENLELSLKQSFANLDIGQLQTLSDYLASVSDGSDRFAIAIDTATQSLADARAADAAAFFDELGSSVTAVAADVADAVAGINTLDIRGAFESIFGKQSVADAAAAAGLGEGLTAVLTGVSASIQPFTDEARALGLAIEDLTDDEATRRVVLTLLSGILGENEAALETVIAAEQDRIDTLNQAREAGAALAEAERELLRARGEALASFQEEVIGRVNGADAARDFRLLGAGLGDLVDDIQGIARSGGIETAKDRLEEFFGVVQAGNFSADQIAAAGREAVSAFDAVAAAAANANQTITSSAQSTVDSLTVSIRASYSDIFGSINSLVSDFTSDVQRSADSAISAVNNAYARQLSDISRLQEEYERAAGRANDLLISLSLESTTAENRLGIITGQFQEAAGRAASGSAGSIDALASLTPTFLGALADQFGVGTREYFEGVIQAQEAAQAAADAASEKAAETATRRDRVLAAQASETAAIRRAAEKQIELITQQASDVLAEFAKARDVAIETGAAQEERLAELAAIFAQAVQLLAQGNNNDRAVIAALNALEEAI